MTEVVSAVLVKNGRVLFAQRPADKPYTFRWETAGGKLEPGESHHEAVRRELREELGLEIGEIEERPLWSGEVPLEGRPSVHLSFYLVRSWAGSPSPREGQGFGWFAPAEFRRLVLMPANMIACEVIANLIDRSPDR